MSNLDEYNIPGLDPENGENKGNDKNNDKKENGDKISKDEVAGIVLDMAQNSNDAWNMFLSMYESEGAEYAHDKGVSGKAYMQFIEALDLVDKPNKSGKLGTYTQDEATKAINRIKGLSRKEKAALWQSVNTTWKNNPFN